MHDPDKQYMARALELAARGKGRTSPNPMVGCVIERNGLIIGEGFHARAGAPHAEIVAMEAAGGDIAGATVYLNLEPCTHTGKTPPCAPALIEKKPGRVVVAMRDPNPKVAGRGIDQLRDAGIRVDVGVLEDEAQTLNEAFAKHITTGRPFVIAKCAMTLDGKIATRSGHARWITSEEARLTVHRLRNEVDAILVGSRTVMLDDPSLTTRLNEPGVRDPVRVILDAEEYLDENRRVFHVASSAPTWVASTSEHEYPAGTEVIHVPPGPGGVDMAALMEALGARGITSLLIEGGGTTHASAFTAGIVDKAWFFIAPKIIGGRDAITAVEGDGVDTMDEAILLERMTVRSVGPDLLIEAYVTR